MSASPLFSFLLIAACACLTALTVFAVAIGVELWLVLRRANQVLPQVQACAREGERCLHHLNHIAASGARISKSTERVVLAGCTKILTAFSYLEGINHIAHALIGGRVGNGHHSSKHARVPNSKKQPQGRGNHG